MNRFSKSTLIAMFFSLYFFGIYIQSVQGQDQNAPPILYIRERNWRIPETEQVGQIIDRVRADDPDGDNLVFGLETRFLPQDGVLPEKLPFRIDPQSGVIYLNESLLGRAGENFLIYITVSDGRYTAKNEVFINILDQNEKIYKIGSKEPPSITNVVRNISQFLPKFENLPGVQTLRNQNRRPINHLFSDLTSESPLLNFYPTEVILNVRPTEHKGTIQNQLSINDSHGLINNDLSESSVLKSRTKLTPVNLNPSSSKNNISDVTYKAIGADGKNSTDDLTYPFVLSLKPAIIPALIAVFGLFVAVIILFAFLFRKRLCALSTTVKKKSKQEMVKKLNQSNVSNALTLERNSIDMQHWNEPLAYGNRYAPWNRNQSLNTTTTEQLSCAGRNGEDVTFSSMVDGGTGLPSKHDYGRDTVNYAKYDRWEFPRYRLKFFNILGEGAFGQVWRCEATDIDSQEGVTTVAVKTLKESATEVEKKDLLSELEVMKSLEPHINVVRLLGCCTDKDPTFVIIEYVSQGKLQTFLRNSRAERHYGNTHGKSNILTSADLTSFMYQIAKGMDYLTSKGIIHRDLAARNILITDNHTCKIADFGFARDVITSKIYERKSEGKLPIRWMAIESLYDNIFSVKSDIWSFGILMWEIVTLGSTPYPGISASDVMRKIKSGYRLEKPEHCRRELYNIMYYCWSEDAIERPTFSEIVQMLDKLLQTEMDYIELDHFPDHNYYNIKNLSGEKL